MDLKTVLAAFFAILTFLAGIGVLAILSAIVFGIIRVIKYFL
jgi:hypothetical protein